MSALGGMNEDVSSPCIVCNLKKRETTQLFINRRMEKLQNMFSSENSLNQKLA